MNAIKVIKTMQMHAVLDLTLYTRELLNSIFHSPFVEFIGVRFTLCDKTFFISLSTYSTQVHLKTIIQAYKKMLFLKYKFYVGICMPYKRNYGLDKTKNTYKIFVLR